MIPDVTGPTLRDALTEQIDTPSSTLHTDAWQGYREVGKKFVVGTRASTHSSHVRGKVTTNQAEGFFSQLKRRSTAPTTT